MMIPVEAFLLLALVFANAKPYVNGQSDQVLTLVIDVLMVVAFAMGLVEVTESKIFNFAVLFQLLASVNHAYNLLTKRAN